MTCFKGDHQSNFKLICGDPADPGHASKMPPHSTTDPPFVRSPECLMLCHIFPWDTLLYCHVTGRKGGGGPGTLAKTHQTVWMFCPRRHQQGFPYGYKWSVILARATIRFNVKQENEMKIQIRYLLNPMLIKKKKKKNSFKNRPSKALRSKTDLKRHVQTAAHVFSNPCTLAWLRSTIYTSHCAVKLVDPIQTGCMLIL